MVQADDGNPGIMNPRTGNLCLQHERARLAQMLVAFREEMRLAPAAHDPPALKAERIGVGSLKIRALVTTATNSCRQGQENGSRLGPPSKRIDKSGTFHLGRMAEIESRRLRSLSAAVHPRMEKAAPLGLFRVIRVIRVIRG